MGTNHLVLSREFWSGFETGVFAALVVLLMVLLTMYLRNELHLGIGR